MKEGWKYMKLGEVYPILMGKTPPRNNSTFWDTKKITNNLWVSIADLSKYEGKEIHDTKEYITDEGAKNITQVTKGSLLVSFKLTLGKMAFAGEQLYTNEAIMSLPPKDGIDLKFLFYYFSSLDWNQLVSGNEKVKGKTLNKKSLSGISVPILQISDQQRIVSYLDSAFAQIDELKVKAEQQLNEAKSLFQKALEKAMEPKEGWEKKTLKEIGITQTGTTPSKNEVSNYGDYLPFIRPSEIDFDGSGNIQYNSEIKLSEKGLSNGRLFKKKSILMVCIGATIGKVGFCTQDVSCNQQINVLTPNEEYDYKYLYYAMRNQVFQAKVIKDGTSAQATLPIINKGKWEKLSIFVPSLSEQQRIVERLDSLSKNVKALEENQRKVTAECDALKQALLREVFE